MWKAGNQEGIPETGGRGDRPTREPNRAEPARDVAPHKRAPSHRLRTGLENGSELVALAPLLRTPLFPAFPLSTYEGLDVESWKSGRNTGNGRPGRPTNAGAESRRPRARCRTPQKSPVASFANGAGEWLRGRGFGSSYDSSFSSFPAFHIQRFGWENWKAGNQERIPEGRKRAGARRIPQAEAGASVAGAAADSVTTAFETMRSRVLSKMMLCCTARRRSRSLVSSLTSFSGLEPVRIDCW